MKHSSVLRSRSSKIVKSKPKVLHAIERRLIIEKLGRRCNWCNVYTDDSIYNDNSSRKTTIDHIYNKLDPRRRWNNDKVVVACESCNLIRARMHEFIFGQKFPVKYALDKELLEDKIVSPAPIFDLSLLNPIIRGPIIVRMPPKVRLSLVNRWITYLKKKLKRISLFKRHFRINRSFRLGE